MLTKIKRQDCLSKFPKFPQRDYDKSSDEEGFFYPKIQSLYWLKLESKSSRGLTSLLATEITSLFKKLNINKLVFLGDTKRPWISRLSAERINYRPFTDAATYLTENKIGKRFNGAIEVDISSLSVFIRHFYIMTRCDASFAYFHFMDEGQNIIGYIHYSGEVRIDTLNKKTDMLFLDKIKTTKFQDDLREGSDRI
jgi:hypothetical protein